MDNNSSAPQGEEKGREKDPVYYRNKDDLISNEGIEVEAGSLWEEKSPGILILVDDDQYASHALDDEKFNRI